MPIRSQLHPTDLTVQMYQADTVQMYHIGIPPRQQGDQEGEG